MNKIKISADSILSIFTGLLNNDEINTTITDISAPNEWQGKKVNDILNIEYYTFRHRPVNSEIIVADMLKRGENVDLLYSLTRSFCLLSLKSVDRVFSKNIDTVTVAASLEYWLQSYKVKLLEDLFEDLSMATNGVRIPVKIGDEERLVLVALGNLNTSELEENTEYGEMSVCDIDIDFIFTPMVTSRNNYTLQFLISNEWIELPFSGISIDTNMTQKGVPKTNYSRSVGMINLSRLRSITLTFDGYKNKFIKYIRNYTLSDSEGMINNQLIKTKITLDNFDEDVEYIYDLVIKEHSIIIQDGTDNETHKLILVTYGGIIENSDE